LYLCPCKALFICTHLSKFQEIFTILIQHFIQNLMYRTIYCCYWIAFRC
jgi:hypothetical protein